MAFPNNPTSPPVLELNSHAINSSCVGFWPLTQVSGTVATDISTNGNDGTESGGVTWASTDLGNAASFDGTDDRFEVDDAGDFDFGTGDFSVSAWVYFDAVPASIFHFVSRGDTILGSACWFALLKTSANNFNFVVDDNVTKREAIGSTTVAPGAWYHVVGVRNSSGTNVLYVNGGSDGTVADNGNSVSQSDVAYRKLRLSSVANGGVYNRFHDGNIQNVRVFNTALSASDVALLYSRPWVGTDYDETFPYSPPVPSSMSLSTDTAATSLNSGCVAWWPLTEGTGTVATDIVGSNNGAESGGVGWTDTAIGSAASLDGVDDYFSADAAVIPSFPFTFSAWVNSEDTSDTYKSIVSFGKSTDQYYYAVVGFKRYTSDGPVARCVWRTGSSGSLVNELSTSTTVQDGEWHHLVGVFESSGALTLYVDGVLEASATNTPSSPQNFDTVRIGALKRTGAEENHYQGEAQNVRIWNRALTADEVTLLYERPWEGESTYGDLDPYDPPPTLALKAGEAINTDCVGWWPLLETDDYASGAADISGNGNTMTNVNSVISYPSSLGASAYFGTGSSRFELANPGIALSTGFTVSAWARFDTASSVQSDVVGADGGTGARNFQLKRESSGVAQFAVFESTATSAIVLSGSKTLDAGNWYHMVGTYDSSNGLVIYIDGAQDATDTSTHATMFTLDDAADSMDIGHVNRGADHHEGNIQNVRIWSRALSAAEVQSLYETPWIGSNYPTVAEIFNYIYRSKRFRRL